ICAYQHEQCTYQTSSSTENNTLSLHDALPISPSQRGSTAKSEIRMTKSERRPKPGVTVTAGHSTGLQSKAAEDSRTPGPGGNARSEEHTSELQSLAYLVCSLLLEKKKCIRHLI